MKTLFQKMDHWFFAEMGPYRPAALRIAFGLLALLIFSSHIPQAQFHFSNDGWLPNASRLLDVDGDPRWTLFFWGSSVAWTYIAFAVSMLFAICVTIGILTPITVPLLWFAFVSMKVRNYFVTDGTDWVIVIALMFLIFMKSGEVWSLDSYFRKNKVRKNISVWPLRMLQIQICLMYLVAGSTKLLGKQWWEGSAVSLLLMSRNYARWDLSWVGQISVLVFLSQCMTWIIPVWEMLFSFLVISKRSRLWALGLGVCVHMSIALFLKISYFSYAMMAIYIIFLSDEQINLASRRV